MDFYSEGFSAMTPMLSVTVAVHRGRVLDDLAFDLHDGRGEVGFAKWPRDIQEHVLSVIPPISFTTVTLTSPPTTRNVP